MKLQEIFKKYSTEKKEKKAFKEFRDKLGLLVTNKTHVSRVFGDKLYDNRYNTTNTESYH